MNARQEMELRGEPELGLGQLALRNEELWLSVKVAKTLEEITRDDASGDWLKDDNGDLFYREKLVDTPASVAAFLTATDLLIGVYALAVYETDNEIIYRVPEVDFEETLETLDSLIKDAGSWVRFSDDKESGNG